MRSSDFSRYGLNNLIVCSGNPGLLDFYVPFLNAIHHDAITGPGGGSSSELTGLVIFAHAHLGLSSYIGGDGRSYPETDSVALPAQIQAHIEFLDELLVAYGPATRVLLVGHSIGCWFIQEVLKARRSALCSRVGAYMLFPTISHMARTPRGRQLSVRVSSFIIDRSPFLTLSVFALHVPKPLFRPPWPRVIAYLSLLVQNVPLCILGLVHPSWPKNHLQVLHNFLRAPAAIYAGFTMANDEMETVRELDVDFLQAFAENLWLYYAEEDHWVGEQREVVLRALRGTPAESRVVRGRNGIPHAFCISAQSSFPTDFVSDSLPRQQTIVPK
jgi:pimeloyl-ACP methyl ester carboxylesterase